MQDPRYCPHVNMHINFGFSYDANESNIRYLNLTVQCKECNHMMCFPSVPSSLEKHPMAPITRPDDPSILIVPMISTADPQICHIPQQPLTQVKQ